MDHVFHIFGGGCGEHLIWPWVAATVSGTSGTAVFLRAFVWHKSSKKKDND